MGTENAVSIKVLSLPACPSSQQPLGNSWTLLCPSSPPSPREHSSAELGSSEAEFSPLLPKQSNSEECPLSDTGFIRVRGDMATTGIQQGLAAP
jgi:hypothetical protein